MRDFNEIKAEILRRSDKRIKEKKRKRKVFTAYALSLCLCITVAVVLAPKFLKLRESLTDKAPTDGAYYGTEMSATEEMSKTTMLEPSIDLECDSAEVVAISAELKHSNGNTVTVGQSDAIRLSNLLQYVGNSSVPDDEGGVFEEGEVEETFSKEAGAEVVVPPCDSSFDAVYGSSIIVINYKDGSKAVYKLCGNTVENTATGESLFLTEGEYEFIEKLFS